MEKLLKEKISTLKKDTNKMPHINKVIDSFLFFKKNLNEFTQSVGFLHIGWKTISELIY